MYDYQTLKPEVFKEENQERFLQARDTAFDLLEASGAVTMGRLIGAGDSWVSMAFIDRLVEIGELREIPQKERAGQDRIFVRA